VTCDTSNFDKAHPQYSTKNRKVLGKFKSETGSVAPKEFVGLRAKMYSLSVPEKLTHNKIRVKGVKRSYVHQNVRHQQFVQTLSTLTGTTSKFRIFRSKRHSVATVEVTKTCLDLYRSICTKCVSRYTTVCIRLHQRTSLNCSPVYEVTESANRGHLRCAARADLAVDYPAPEQRDTAKDVSLFLVRACRTHSHCQFVTGRWLTQFCALLKTAIL